MVFSYLILVATGVIEARLRSAPARDERHQQGERRPAGPLERLGRPHQAATSSGREPGEMTGRHDALVSGQQTGITPRESSKASSS